MNSPNISMSENTNSDSKDYVDWEMIRLRDDGRFPLPAYCIKAGYFEGRHMYVGHVRGEFSISGVETLIDAPAKILYGKSAAEDKVTFTFRGTDKTTDFTFRGVEHDAFQEGLDVGGYVCPKKTLVRVKKNDIDTKFKDAVEVNSDNDPDSEDGKYTYISRYVYWVSPKELKSPEKHGVYKPFEAGQNYEYMDDGRFEILYVGRTSSYTENPHIPGKVVLEVPAEDGKPGRPGKIFFGDGAKEHDYEDPEDDEGTYKPTYEILATGPRRILENEGERKRKRRSNKLFTFLTQILPCSIL